MVFRRLPPVHVPISSRALVGAALRLTRWSDTAAEAVVAVGAHFPGRSVHLTASGTAALAAAIQSGHHEAGGREGPLAVALPAWGCPDLGAAAVALRADIHLYDLDPRTLEPDYSSLRRCLSAGARSVVLVHFFGRIVDPAPIAALAREFGATVIEDAAQAAGAFLDGVRAGGLTERGVLSFGRGKGCNAGGGGALLLTSPFHEDAAPPTAEGRGWTRLLVAAATSWLSHPRAYWIPAAIPWLGLGDTVYHALATERRVSPVSLALLPHAMGVVDEMAQGRREQLAHWRSHLDEAGVPTIAPAGPRVLDGALRLPLMLSKSAAAPLRRYGVVRSYPRGLGSYSQIRARLAHPAQHCPGAEELADRLHTLPTHRYVSELDRRVVVRALAAGGT